MKVAVIAHVGTTNLGDEAVVAGALEALRRELPDATLRVYTPNPDDTARRHGVDTQPLRSSVLGGAHGKGAPVSATVGRPPVPDQGPGSFADGVRRFLRGIPVLSTVLRGLLGVARGVPRFFREIGFIFRSWRSLRGFDLTLIAGSNQLEDWFGGPWNYPYTILLWSVLGRLAGTRVAFIAVGAGPLDAGLSRRMCVLALRRASYASFRDADSLALMRRLGFTGPAEVVPDLAFALRFAPPAVRTPAQSLTIGINVFPFRDPDYIPRVTDSGAAFRGYRDALAAVAADAVGGGHRVLFFGSQRADRRVLDFIRDRLPPAARDSGSVAFELPEDLGALVSAVDRCDVIVGTRFHGILFGILRGRPTVGICYQAKSRRLLEMAGAGEYAVDANAIEAGPLVRLVAHAAASSPGGVALLARAGQLQAEFDARFSEALRRCLPGAISPAGAVVRQ